MMINIEKMDFHDFLWACGKNRLRDAWPSGEADGNGIALTNGQRMASLDDIKEELLAEAERLFREDPRWLYPSHAAELLRRDRISRGQADRWHEQYGTP